MLFVALLKIRAGTLKERGARRLKWQVPEGVQLIAEYWLQTNEPNVISIFEAKSIAPIMATLCEWDDVFDITVVPAITAEAGLQLVRHKIQQ